jgi:hypothetical protein
MFLQRPDAGVLKRKNQIICLQNWFDHAFLIKKGGKYLELNETPNNVSGDIKCIKYSMNIIML